MWEMQMEEAMSTEIQCGDDEIVLQIGAVNVCDASELCILMCVGATLYAMYILPYFFKM